MKEMYGYVRVSSKDQCEERQLIAMQEFGISQKTSFWINSAARILIVPDINECCGNSIPAM